MSNKGVYEHQRATTSDKRVFLLTRSSFLGQQRYASHSWSGDVVSTWDVMRKQLAAGLNYTLCGIPYWNTDLGGFFAWRYNNNVNNIAYHELHVRWYQWGVFQPIMRSHNSSPVAVEIYQFGKKGDWSYDALEKYIPGVYVPTEIPVTLHLQHFLGSDQQGRQHHAPAYDGLPERQKGARYGH